MVNVQQDKEIITRPENCIGWAPAQQQSLFLMEWHGGRLAAAAAASTSTMRTESNPPHHSHYSVSVERESEERDQHLLTLIAFSPSQKRGSHPLRVIFSTAKSQ